MSDDVPQTESAELPRTRAELLRRIQRSREALEAQLRRLTEEQLDTPGGPDGWSVKNHIAHLTAWQAGIDALLRRQPRYEAMGLTREEYLSGGMDGINRQQQQRSSAQPLERVLSEFRQSLAALLATIEALPEEELFKPYHYFQPDEPGKESDDPIVGWIAGNTYEHYDEHSGWIAELVGS